MAFDPNAAAQPGSGVFGLPHSREQARVLLLPVPFDATTSYTAGTADGPQAIRRASMQVDLWDHQFGRTYQHGVFMEPESEEVRAASRSARALAEPIIDRGGASGGDRAALARIDEACESVGSHVRAWTTRVLADGKVPGVVGGDHSVPFGAIRACAEAVGEIGVLQVDAHMDLREAYEGFRWSHASIMYNVLEHVPAVTRLVQVGIRDYCESESEVVRATEGRVQTHFDMDWAARLDTGEPFLDLCRGAVEPLPSDVYISFDIDGLDPALCPHTGTPVPGGLSFNRACALLEALRGTGRRIVGFDLCEVRPAGGGEAGTDDWDANVGARLLYKLCGAALGPHFTD